MNYRGIVTQNFNHFCHIRSLTNDQHLSGMALIQLHNDNLKKPAIFEYPHPVVGDFVRYRRQPDGGLVVEKIYRRRNQIIRQVAGAKFIKKHVIAANLNGVLICQAITDPLPNFRFIDRLIVFAHSQNINVEFVWTKCDIVMDQKGNIHSNLHKDFGRHFKVLSDVYFKLPYRSYFVDPLDRIAKTSNKMANYFAKKLNFIKDLEQLSAKIDDGFYALLGPSGVGKSTLIRKITGNESIRTSEVNTRIQKGRHATTQACLYPRGQRGGIIDTAGLREYGLVGLGCQQISDGFVEFGAFRDYCGLHNCQHIHEPDCAVLAGLNRGEISLIRYQSYVAMVASMEEKPHWKKKKNQVQYRNRK